MENTEKKEEEEEEQSARAEKKEKKHERPKRLFYINLSISKRITNLKAFSQPLHVRIKAIIVV